MKRPLEDTGIGVRTLTSLRECSKLPPSRPARQRLGSKVPPLLEIDTDHVVIDELHLLLRIMDVLLRNLIHMMVKLDRSSTAGTSSNHLSNLIGAIRQCGISFSVWEPRDPATGKKTGVYDWTSLMGNDIKRLLKVCIIRLYMVIMLFVRVFSTIPSPKHKQELPSKLTAVFGQLPDIPKVVKLWNVSYCMHTCTSAEMTNSEINLHNFQDFATIYKVLSSWTPTETGKQSLHDKVPLTVYVE